ncbi:hypothetical protein [Pseudogemmobacter humi]|uniref:Uncharacterized protein n=1 Tax=Pseudogemmobacter humi TaxID=2483812 RepID=A0A3P5XMF8_9RHOB|nr:hypothetical protein [Pseudogemmobacter humi]VDC31970.1 hypothetical protein XINFAN_03251 [Pseudogemmobacter humi]
MDPMRWLLRAKRWAAHPPPMRRVLLVLGVIAACLALAAFEWIWGWPAWLTVNRMRP